MSKNVWGRAGIFPPNKKAISIWMRFLIIFSVSAIGCQNQNSNRAPASSIDKISGGVMGGEPVSEADEAASSVVSVYYPGIKYLCSGVLIAPQFVVTAAHCVKENESGVVVFGSIYSTTAKDGKKHRAEGRAMQLARVHPLYDHESKKDRYDIAVIQLDEAAPISVNPMPIISYDDFPRSMTEKVKLIGYGLESAVKTGRRGFLRSATINLPPQDSTKIEFDLAIQNGVGFCVGDSGGPVVVERRGKPYLLAIDSVDMTFKSSLYPDSAGFCDYKAKVTNVFLFKKWIQDQILEMQKISSANQ